MKKRPAVISVPDRMVRKSYNCIGSGGFFVTVKSSDVNLDIDVSRGLV